MYNPVLSQQMAQLEQEYAQKKSMLMQSFYNQPQIWGQPSTPAQQTTQPAPIQNVNWIQVSGIDGAKNQIVQPGQTAWMMDNNQPYFYVKSVDEVGSSSLRVFQFAEVADVSQEQSTQPQIDPSQYVQRDEFERFKEQMKQLANEQKKLPNKANKEVVENG